MNDRNIPSNQCCCQLPGVNPSGLCWECRKPREVIPSNERVAFERWAALNGYATARGNREYYDDAHTNFVWTGWKARGSGVETPAEPKPDDPVWVSPVFGCPTEGWTVARVEHLTTVYLKHPNGSLIAVPPGHWGLKALAVKTTTEGG